MKKFNLFIPVFGTWFEGRKRLDGIIDLEHARSHRKIITVIEARDAEHALDIAKQWGFKAPIVGEAIIHH